MVKVKKYTRKSKVLLCPKCGEKLHKSRALDEVWCDCGFNRHWKERYQ